MRAEGQGVSLTAGALGKELRLTPGATTFLITRLRQAGLVERGRDFNDRRKVQLSLSATGRELAAAMHQPVHDASAAVLDAFTPAKLESVARFLSAATTAMTDYRTSLLLIASDLPPSSKG